jgi:hypothetical protein
LIALEDMGVFSMWLFDNPSESARFQLKVATDEVTFDDIVKTFTAVTGKKAKHQFVPIEQFLPMAEPFPNAMANWAAGPGAVRDESTQTWRENFGAWWRYWGEGKCEKRDFALLDRIHPKRIKNLQDWMEKVGYDGSRKNVLKGIEDLKKAAAAQQQSPAGLLETKK